MEGEANENHGDTTKEMDDSGITMVDVLQEEEELENDAEAVLGAGDDSSCTYTQGYMKRQPLYACLTCCPVSSGTRCGICLGCSYHCHEGHELVELYTKRYCKCDCGTSRFPSFKPCKLLQDKSSDVNVDNEYNQNFEGKYCTCSRPYPDPEDATEDSMVQCIICEDWHHGRHSKVKVLPNDEDFSEMICHTCVPKLPFLRYYLGAAVTPVDKDETAAEVDVMASPNKESETKEENLTNAVNEESKEAKKTISAAAEGRCKLKNLEELPASTGALFFAENWRQKLCTCSGCQETYKRLKVSFLSDPEDTVGFYESEGRAKRQAARGVQREIDALSTLDRITRTEVVHEYNNLSTSLREYLKKFAENGKVVETKDIREFFSELSANKKRKSDHSAMQYFCK